MKFDKYDIVFSEMPGHIALAFSITGCPHGCEGCHSSHLAEDTGTLLAPELYTSILSKYRAHITAVLFLGGEWYAEEFKVLKTLSEGLKFGIYSGADKVDRSIVETFDVVKVGKFNGKPLTDNKTNQRYYVKDPNGIFADETYRFWKFK